MRPFLILLSALFTGATALCLGLLLLSRLRVVCSTLERYLFSFVAGSACLSLIVFSTATLGIVRPGVFAVIGVAAIAACFYMRVWRIAGHPLPVAGRFWRYSLGGAFLLFGTFYLAHAWAPENSPDGSAYHLGVVSRYLRQHGFGRITTNMYANLSEGIEMLFLFAFAFGRHSAAALTHLQFLFVLPLMLYAFGRRFGSPAGGAAGALLLFLSPVVALDGASAYIDVAMACVLFAVFFALELWRESGSRGWLSVAGILAGFAYACKYTAFLAVPFAVLYVVWRQRGQRALMARNVALVASLAAVSIAPWMIKNAVIVGNPVSPFLNRYFPNPNVRISFEEEYVRLMRTYEGITSYTQAPLEITVRGGVLQGLTGPIFLLTPLALLAARNPIGRRVLLAGAVFGLPWLSNMGTRFLMGALPFLSLALGLALARWQSLAGAVVVLHAVLSWPPNVEKYSDPYAWRFHRFRMRQALRQQPEHDFLMGMSRAYQAADAVNRHVPEGGRVFCFGGIAEGYSKRELLVAYQGALNNMLGETLETPLVRERQPTRLLTFDFPERMLHRIRIQQTAVTEQIWSLSEITLHAGRVELPRKSQWRISASPNPWDVQLAFDGCPLTRWKAWERSKPGMTVELDLAGSTAVSRVAICASADQPDVRISLEGDDGSGQWRLLGDKPAEQQAPAVRRIRRAAIEDIHRYGISHIYLQNSDYAAKDFDVNRESWGVTPVATTEDGVLYRID